MKYWIPNVNGFASQQKPIQYEVNEAGEQVISPSYVPYKEYTDEEVQAMFREAFEKGGIIVDKDGEPTISIPDTPQLTDEERQAQYEEYVNQLIREKYSLSQELAILRQRDTKADEYEEYNTFCEACKKVAKAKYNIGE